MRNWFLGFCLLVTKVLFAQIPAVELIVLGTVQDAGAPQLGCQKKCCIGLSLLEKEERKGSSLALLLADSEEVYLFDISMDIPDQWQQLPPGSKNIKGVFLTHAHMGHYTGLLHLGREAWNTHNTKVYAMPRMQQFLRSNAPWEQLISLQNIQLQALEDQREVVLSTALRVTPIRVPHRDEYSETVAYWIQGPQKSALYLPDIDKWERWETPIEQWLEKVDYAFLDATFFDEKELPNRSMAEIPHPFVVESIERFKNLDKKTRKKVYFIHLNHTNPLLREDGAERKRVESLGFSVAKKGQRFVL